MATRVEKIIERARDILADDAGDRWSDAKMLRWLDEAYEFCVMNKDLLRSYVLIPLLSDTRVITLPDEVYRPTRVTYNGVKIGLVSHEYLDKQLELSVSPKSWETVLGTKLEALVFDRQNIRQLKLFPIIEGQTITPICATGNGITDQIDDVYATEPYGIVSLITFSGAEEGIFTTNFGIIDCISDVDEIKVYYSKKSAEILSLQTELEVDDVHLDTALKYYIVALALTADIDTQNNAISNKYFALSGEYLDKVAQHSSDDFIQSEHNTHYKGFV